MSLPRTPKDALKLGPADWLLYNGLLALFRASGIWRYPARSSGDLETMRLLDKIYWLYKTQYPVRRARKGSGLEEHFERQKRHRWALPAGFSAEAAASITAAGDLIDHPYLRASAGELYAEVADILFGADLPMANLECVIHPGGKGAFAFTTKSGPPLYYDPAGFGVVKGDGRRKFGFLATACNHSLDFGEAGVASTISALNSDGIAFNGINATEEDAGKATVVERNGIKLGILAHTFGLNAYRPPEGRPRIVNRTNLNDEPASVDLRQIESQLRHCRDSGVDFTIAHLHWGMEHEFYPSPEQVELAHRLAEMGADAIVGHHPHVVQPFENYVTRRDPDRVVPIWYSLGNLINTFSAPYLTESAVARIELCRGRRADGKRATYVREASWTRVEQAVDEKEKKIRLKRARG